MGSRFTLGLMMLYGTGLFVMYLLTFDKRKGVGVLLSAN